MLKLKKLFKFLLNLAYPVAAITFILVYVSTILNKGYPGDIIQIYLYVGLPILLALVLTGLIGTLVLHIKDACVERKEIREYKEASNDTPNVDN